MNVYAAQFASTIRNAQLAIDSAPLKPAYTCDEALDVLPATAGAAVELVAFAALVPQISTANFVHIVRATCCRLLTCGVACCAGELGAWPMMMLMLRWLEFLVGARHAARTAAALCNGARIALIIDDAQIAAAAVQEDKKALMKAQMIDSEWMINLLKLASFACRRAPAQLRQLDASRAHIRTHTN